MFPGNVCFKKNKSNPFYPPISLNSEIRQLGLLIGQALLHYVIKRCSFECKPIRDVLDMVQVKTLNVAFTTVLKDLRIPVLFKANVLSRE